MLHGPAPSPSGWADDPVPTPDWMTEEEWLARCKASPDEEPPPPYEDEFWDPADVIAEADQAAADEAAAAEHIASLGKTAAMAAAASARRGLSPDISEEAGLIRPLEPGLPSPLKPAPARRAATEPGGSRLPATAPTSSSLSSP